jgi:hypothetical protein
MDSVCLGNTTKDCGTNMDKQGFDNWLFDNFKLRDLPDTNTRELLWEAWQAAIKYEQDKPIRSYRWNGVLT